MKYLILKRLNFISEFLRRRYSPEFKNFKFTENILDGVLKPNPSGSYTDIITNRYRLIVNYGFVTFYDNDNTGLIQFFIFSDYFTIYNTAYSYREVNYEVFDI